MSYHLIVAIDKNCGIGNNGTIPWYIKNDLKHFSNITKGNGKNAVIMGKNTWHSINSKCLKGRINIVLSKTMKLINASNTDNPDYIFNSIEDCVNYCNSLDIDEFWIIGGEELYKSFLELNICSSAHITVIENNYKCDRYFPLELCKSKMLLDSVRNLETDMNVKASIYKYVKLENIIYQSMGCQ